LKPFICDLRDELLCPVLSKSFLFRIDGRLISHFAYISTKRLVAAAKFLVVATKNLFVVPTFVALTKPFFSVWCHLTSFYKR